MTSTAQQGQRQPRRVYFIKPIGMDGPIKIGCSCSPDGRRKTLETWSPFPLEILAEIEGGIDLEHRFHALFKDRHERREWFTACPEISETIAAIKEGTFDIASLPHPEYLRGDKAAVSASHRASWTPERRLLASYQARVRCTQLKTRTVCKHYATRIGDPAIRAEIDRYLADPLEHGEPLAANIARMGRVPWWARNLPASELRNAA